MAEPLRYNAGIVTAYGAAVRGGYTGTYEDFCRQQAGYAETGAAVEQAKEAAETAASNAESAKSTAQTAAENAGNSATRAGQSATSASESATQAGNSASAATGSANTAGTNALKSEGHAVGQQNGADVASDSPYFNNNAKYYKEQAALSAGQAKEYRDSSQQIADGIETAGATQVQAVNAAGTAQVQAVEDKGEEVLDSIPDDYSNLSNKVSNLDHTINEKAPVIISSASGAIASFPDGADGMPLKSLKVGIEPVQDLHGYDNPWPGGGGENIFDAKSWVLLDRNSLYYSVSEDETITVIVRDVGVIAGRMIELTPDTDYSVFFTNFSNISIFDSYSHNILVRDTFTCPSDGRIAIKLFSDTYPTSGKLIIVKGSTAPTAWTPYSNICPITGHTGANIICCGINLWDEQWESGDYTDADGLPHTQNTRIRTKNAIRCTPSTNYYFVLPSGKQGQIFYYDINDSYILCTAWMPGKQITTPTNCYYIRFYLVSTTEYTNGAGINYPSTDTSYHAYQGVTIPIDWETEAGPVYGGTLDVTTGLLTVDRYFHEFDGTEESIDLDSVAHVMKFTGAQIDNLNAGVASAKFSHGTCTGASTTNMRDGTYGLRENGTNYYKNLALTTVQDFRDYLSAQKTAGTPLQITYIQSTKQTYQLTPIEIRTLLGGGLNNIWADTGDTDIEYPADTKLYIDRKITEAIANALNA